MGRFSRVHGFSEEEWVKLTFRQTCTPQAADAQQVRTKIDLLKKGQGSSR